MLFQNKGCSAILFRSKFTQKGVIGGQDNLPIILNFVLDKLNFRRYHFIDHRSYDS